MHTPPDRHMTSRERAGFAGTLCAIALVVAACALATGCDFQPPPKTAHGPVVQAPPAIPPITREDTRFSVFKIAATHTALDEIGLPESTNWSGTAWIAARSLTDTTLITAGHVCELDTVYTLISRDSTPFEGARVLLDDDKNDICILSIARDMGPPLEIADRDPEYGDRGWYVGAPHGIWGNGIAGIYELTYSGRGTPFAQEGADPIAMNSALVFSSAEAAPGASGSAAIVNGRVVAMINLVSRSFQTFTTAVPWEVLRADLVRVHRY